MSAAETETILARLYVDAAFRARFLSEPNTALVEVGASAETRRLLASIDREGLVLAAQSFAAKRAATAPPSPPGWGWQFLSRLRRRTR